MTANYQACQQLAMKVISRSTNSRMKVISKLKQLCEKEGISQKQLAEETGISPTTIGKIYRSHFDRIDCNTVTVLCSRFSCRSISELIEIED